MHMKRKNWDVDDIARQLRAIYRQAASSYNDGYTASGCKHDLFILKCLIEDLYADIPSFAGEEKWYEERTLELLKKKHSNN